MFITLSSKAHACMALPKKIKKKLQKSAASTVVD